MQRVLTDADPAVVLFREKCLNPLFSHLPRNYIADVVSVELGIDFRIQNGSYGEGFILIEEKK